MSKLESLFVDGELVLGARETDQLLQTSEALETPFLSERAYAFDQDPRVPRTAQRETVAATAGAQAAATFRKASLRCAPGRVADEAAPWSQGEWDDEGDGVFGADHDFESELDSESEGDLESEGAFEGDASPLLAVDNLDEAWNDDEWEAKDEFASGAAWSGPEPEADRYQSEWQVLTDEEASYADCNPEQRKMIAAAATRALRAVNLATAVVGTGYGRPDKMRATTTRLLQTHFRTTKREHLRKILSTLMGIGKVLAEGVRFECEKTCDLDGVVPEGYAINTMWFGGFGAVHVCFDKRLGDRSFDKLTARDQEVLIIHEVAHRYEGLDDHAYEWQKPAYDKLSVKKALDNADTYAFFCVDLMAAQASPPGTASGEEIGQAHFADAHLEALAAEVPVSRAESPCEREIMALVAASPLPAHKWRGRGRAPIGYLNGMALSFGRVYCKLRSGDVYAVLMARKPDLAHRATDAMAHLDQVFRHANMANDHDGVDTLRHLFVMLIGLGMRESSGKYCEGIDTTAQHQNHTEIEAGLFQMSYSIGIGNASRRPIHNFYRLLQSRPYDGLLASFAQGVNCGRRQLRDTENTPTGRFRDFCLTQPALFTELAALCVRYRRKHWGPINRGTIELDPGCDQLLRSVQAVVDRQTNCTCLLSEGWKPVAAEHSEHDDVSWSGADEAFGHDGFGEMEERFDEAELTEEQRGEFRRFPNGGNSIDGGEKEYEELRPLLLQKFQSVDNAIAYYRGIGTVRFRGRRFQGHVAALTPRLDAASQRIDAEPGFAAAIDVATLRMGGFNIRRNRNNPSKLSEHSFGLAIDINGPQNSNFGRRFPGREVLALTGEALFTGEAVRGIAAGGTSRALLPLVRRIREASDQCKAAFADVPSLERAMRTYIYGDGSDARTAFDPGKAIDLVPLVRTAAARGASAARNRLIGQLAGNWKNLALLNERRFAELIESRAGLLGPARSRESAAKIRRAEQLEQDSVRTATAVLPADKAQAQAARYFKRALLREVTWAAGTLVAWWRMFQASFVGGNVDSGVRIAANSHGSAATLAAHGFLNLPAELVAALVGNDGGNLAWLGVGRTKDWMHFELRATDQPPFL